MTTLIGNDQAGTHVHKMAASWFLGRKSKRGEGSRSPPPTALCTRGLTDSSHRAYLDLANASKPAAPHGRLLHARDVKQSNECFPAERILLPQLQS